MDTQEITQRVLTQRMARFPDVGPILAPAGEARFRQEGLRLRVAFATLAPGRAAEAITRVQRSARARAQEVHWVTVPQRAGESELPAALTAASFTLTENLLLMAHEGPIHANINPAVNAAPVTTWQAMCAYERGSRQAFFDDSNPAATTVLQRARDRWREQEHGWCRYFTALLRGTMVGGCYVSLFEDVPTIMGVYTVREARRQGVATALLARATEEIVQQGRRACCLFVRHGNPAEHLYLQLGFVPLADERTYVWYPEDAP